ncbi:MAG: hypothetical protein K2Z25_18330 [Beijerinckiaceae bacterium]|mgnify:CR=1 FL=1|nr:hypothetical protein [Beijerinckiaceae bacterium]
MKLILTAALFVALSGYAQAADRGSHQGAHMGHSAQTGHSKSQKVVARATKADGPLVKPDQAIAPKPAPHPFTKPFSKGPPSWK